MPIKMVMQLLNSLNKSQENRILGFISVLSSEYFKTYINEGKDEAIGSRGVIFQSVAGTGSRSYILK